MDNWVVGVWVTVAAIVYAVARRQPPTPYYQPLASRPCRPRWAAAAVWGALAAVGGALALLGAAVLVGWW